MTASQGVLAGFHYRFEPGEAGKPIVLALHGTGGDELEVSPLARFLFPGAPVLSVRGKVQEQGMNRFFRRLTMTTFDEEDVRVRAGELADFVRQAAVKHGFDAGKVVAAGYSNGANVAVALLLLSPETLRGAVLLRATMPLTENVPAPSLHGRRILLSEAGDDPYVPAEKAAFLEKTLRAAGAELTVLWDARSHMLEQSELEKVAGLIARQGLLAV